VDGDGRAEIITGAGPGGGPHVRAFSLVGGTPVEIASFFAYDANFTGGVLVAAGDVTGDGRAAIITGTYQSGGPVRVFTLGPGGMTEHAHFFPYTSAFKGAVRVGTADINGDGVAEIITGAGPGGGPHVRAFAVVGAGLTESASFYAYDPAFCDIGIVDPDPTLCDGVYVGGGDVNGDGVAEIITGTNRQGGPLRVFQIGPGVTELTSFYPYFEAFVGPVYVAAVAPARSHEPLEPLGPPSPPREFMLSMNVDARRMDIDAALVLVAFASRQVDGRERSPPRSASSVHLVTRLLLPDEGECNATAAIKRVRRDGERCSAVPDGCCTASDNADGGAEYDVAEVMAILLQARAADKCGEAVGGDARAPSEVSLQDGRGGEARRCVS